MAVEVTTRSTTATDTVATIKSELRKRSRISETLIEGFLFFCGAISILTTVGIVFVLGEESLLFLEELPLASPAPTEVATESGAALP